MSETLKTSFQEQAWRVTKRVGRLAVTTAEVVFDTNVPLAPWLKGLRSEGDPARFFHGFIPQVLDAMYLMGTQGILAMNAKTGGELFPPKILALFEGNDIFATHVRRRLLTLLA